MYVYGHVYRRGQNLLSPTVTMGPYGSPSRNRLSITVLHKRHRKNPSDKQFSIPFSVLLSTNNYVRSMRPETKQHFTLFSQILLLFGILT